MSQTQFAAIMFNNDATTMWLLDEYQTQGDLLGAVNKLNYIVGGTNLNACVVRKTFKIELYYDK